MVVKFKCWIHKTSQMQTLLWKQRFLFVLKHTLKFKNMPNKWSHCIWFIGHRVHIDDLHGKLSATFYKNWVQRIWISFDLRSSPNFVASLAFFMVSSRICSKFNCYPSIPHLLPKIPNLPTTQDTTKNFVFYNLSYATKKSHMQLFWSCM
jgi:hypothetical protein